MTIYDFHSDLAKSLLGSRRSEEDALTLMILFHTHRIRLREPILEDRPGITEIAAITQRHAADAIAQAWPDRSDERRIHYAYWYWRFNTATPYECAEDIPPDWSTRVQHMRDLAQGQLHVVALEPDD
jgi:hypothetical protein